MPTVDIEKAVEAARNHLSKVFDIDLKSIYLEEVESADDGGWLITFSYYEPLLYENKVLQSILGSTGNVVKRYKIVRLSSDGTPKSIKRHEADR